VIGNSHAMGVATEIAQHLHGAAESGLGINHPVVAMETADEFAGLVVVLRLLTKNRTQCSFFCPFGAFQSVFNKTSVFDVKIDRTRCSPCVLCLNACPTMSLTKESIAQGETLMSCMKYGACVDVCPKHAALWHIVFALHLRLRPSR
jgi:polyferredoxin